MPFNIINPLFYRTDIICKRAKQMFSAIIKKDGTLKNFTDMVKREGCMEGGLRQEVESIFW